MRNVWKTLATVGIAVALAVGPGIGMANAAPLLPHPELLPPDLLPPDLLPGLPLPGLSGLIETLPAPQIKDLYVLNSSG
jgi:hypothetical protein